MRTRQLAISISLALLAIAEFCSAQAPQGRSRAMSQRLTSGSREITIAEASSPFGDEPVIAEEFSPLDELGCDPGSFCCMSATPCSPSVCGRLYAAADYLLWWTDSMNLPPLVTTSPAGTPLNVAGILDQAGTQVLVGGEFGDGSKSGGRVNVGWWLDPQQCQSLEVGYFALGTRSTHFAASSANNPILARPVFDTATNTEAAMLVAHPNLLVGGINVDASTDLHGAELLFRRCVLDICDRRLDFLVGYRFAQLEDHLLVRQSSQFIAPQGNIIIGTTRDLFDRFDTDNRFHGGEFGVELHQKMNCWSLDLLGKVALGRTVTDVVIDGRTTNTVPNVGAATFVGGLLAQQTNIGTFERDSFAVVPELRALLTRDLTCNLRFSFGYNLIYWSTVLRAGDQIDRNVSQFPPTAPAGTRQPAFRPQSQGLFVQGLHLGLEYQF